jgi:hypothetical protein
MLEMLGVQEFQAKTFAKTVCMASFEVHIQKDRKGSFWR